MNLNLQKITMTIFVLIGLYLIISHGKEFNQIIQTGGTTLLKGGALLQGRDIGKVTI